MAPCRPTGRRRGHPPGARRGSGRGRLPRRGRVDRHVRPGRARQSRGPCSSRCATAACARSTSRPRAGACRRRSTSRTSRRWTCSSTRRTRSASRWWPGTCPGSTTCAPTCAAHARCSTTRPRTAARGFDGFAIDIESQRVRPIGARNAAMLRYSRALRRYAGPSYALGAITPDLRSTTVSPGLWPGFPYRGRRALLRRLPADGLLELPRARRVVRVPVQPLEREHRAGADRAAGAHDRRADRR